MTRARGERGAAVVLAPFLVVVLLVTTLAVAAGTSLVASHRRAQAAADLAALAAARATQDGEDPCDRAGRIAARNGARLQGCDVRGFEAHVSVEVTSMRLPGGGVRLRARARAGPVSALER